MSDFYLICGISGSGKTTLAKRIKELNPTKIDEVLDVDEYYAKINGDECNRENPFKIWHTIFQDIHDYEVAEKNIILSTNAIYKNERWEFIQWFPTFNHHMIYMDTPIMKCLENNRNRHRVVPENILLNQWKYMEEPTIDDEKEWWTISKYLYEYDVLLPITGNLNKLKGLKFVKEE